jgi:hypothetical protein
MELDEFKSLWNNIQQKEIEKQKLNTETLDKIIMKAIITLSEIQQRNTFWSKFGGGVCGALIVVLLFNLALSYLIPGHGQTFARSVIPVMIMIVYSVVSIWFYKRQEQIFHIDNNENLKASLTKVITDFKRFYIVGNVLFIFLFPAFYYAFIKLFMTFWEPSTITILWVCGGVTILSFILNHWFYKVKYFKKIKALEESLDELS